MVRKIPKDHKGLYACEPYNHGVQSNVSEEEGCNTLKGAAVRESEKPVGGKKVQILRTP